MQRLLANRNRKGAKRLRTGKIRIGKNRRLYFFMSTGVRKEIKTSYLMIRRFFVITLSYNVQITIWIVV